MLPRSALGGTWQFDADDLTRTNVARATWRKGDLKRRRVKWSRGRQFGRRWGSGGIGVTIRDPNSADPNPPDPNWPDPNWSDPTPTDPTQPQPPDFHLFLTCRPHYTRFASSCPGVKFVRVKSSSSNCLAPPFWTHKGLFCEIHYYGRTKNGASYCLNAALPPKFFTSCALDFT